MQTKLIIFFMALALSAGAVPFDPPEISGWEQEGSVEVFDKDNLFDHINGASEFYFSYNFQKLWVVRYTKDDAEIAVEVYDQGDPVHAYGIFSMERPPEAEVKEIGAQGYYEDNILNFVAGRYYVKMNSYRESDAGSGVLLETAENLSGELSDDPQLPGVINSMPEENLVHNSREYVSNTFMGLDFLGGAYRAKYTDDEEEMTLFVLERDSEEEIENLLAEYHEFAEQEFEDSGDKDFVIEDPFNGTIHMHRTGNYIIGFSGDDVEPLRERLLEKIKQNLEI
ncbi:MAG: DUF6599 family protein [Marinilabilia sp.]